MKHLKVPEVYKISKDQAQEAAQLAKKEMESLWEKHCSEKKDFIALILKQHLIIEKYIDEVLMLCIPKPAEILQNCKFSTKVKILQSLNVIPTPDIVKKIETINWLRNLLVHNLDKNVTELTDAEQKKLQDGLKIGQKALEKEICCVIQGITGYLCSLKNIEKSFPISRNFMRNGILLKNDKAYPYFKMVLALLKKEILEILEYSRL